MDFLILFPSFLALICMALVVQIVFGDRIERYYETRRAQRETRRQEKKAVDGMFDSIEHGRTEFSQMLDEKDLSDAFAKCASLKSVTIGPNQFLEINKTHGRRREKRADMTTTTRQSPNVTRFSDCESSNSPEYVYFEDGTKLGGNMKED